mmetsp:Transcript_17785/g.31332  ORF Transcript_17785/g.31332 Transcript_17785/m.31332 type:complete len:103 (-) Transcript_17785:429-737(-)
MINQATYSYRNSSHAIVGIFSPTCPLMTKSVAYARGASRACAGTIVDVPKPFNKAKNQKFAQPLKSRGVSDYFSTTPPNLLIQLQPPLNKSRDHVILPSTIQ